VSDRTARVVTIVLVVLFLAAVIAYAILVGPPAMG